MFSHWVSSLLGLNHLPNARNDLEASLLGSHNHTLAAMAVRSRVATDELAAGHFGNLFEVGNVVADGLASTVSQLGANSPAHGAHG